MPTLIDRVRLRVRHVDGFRAHQCVDNAGTGTAPWPVNATLSGLQPSTTYFYRLIATSSQGTVTGRHELHDRP